MREYWSPCAMLLRQGRTGTRWSILSVVSLKRPRLVQVLDPVAEQLGIRLHLVEDLDTLDRARSFLEVQMGR